MAGKHFACLMGGTVTVDGLVLSSDNDIDGSDNKDNLWWRWK